MIVQAPDLALDLLKLAPDSATLMELAQRRHSEYVQAMPYPHICFDNFLPEHVAEAVLDAFPAPEDLAWIKFKNDREVKLAKNQEEFIPPAIRNVLYTLNGATFLRFLETLTGISGVLPDPQFIGGGMHQIQPGGKLGVHVDFNRHQHYQLDRRLNLLIYLNKDWEESYKGHFELYDRTGTKCLKKYLPVFNRCVIFSTSEISYHGHPDPLACPPDRTRKSIALYYYTNGRPLEERATIHSTVFANSPSGRQHFGAKAMRAVKLFARELVPPVISRLWQR
jgi:Rps23 Pro-64 3,4-dihydroxylase Tpa1-like proline 4-hydroxylase